MSKPVPEITGMAGIGGSNGAIITVSAIPMMILARRGMLRELKTGSAIKSPRMRNSGHKNALSMAAGDFRIRQMQGGGNHSGSLAHGIVLVNRRMV